ncbi:hypothetical protein QBC44DRAFT_336965 [Cladorrhinum sp. PSN332]|nr:hypothetical protein QBC44DRAFT_336965 [Cladorrhinum sp. PSN332]
MYSLNFLLLNLLSTLSLANPTPSKPPKITELYSFTPSNPIFLENLHQLPDSRLLISSFSPNGSLYILDPRKPHTAPITATNFPNATIQLGIAPLGNHKYAIATGILGDLVFVHGTGNIRIISLPPNAQTAKQIDVIPVPDTWILNGLIALPAKPHILLSADSTEGRILRINTQTRQADVAFADPLLDANNHPVLPLGVNGIRIRDGYLYFTNSARGIFGRVKIDQEGNKTGNVEVLYQLVGETGFENAYDDFVLDERTGDAYVTWHDRSLVRLRRQGRTWRQEVIVGRTDGIGSVGEAGAVVLKAPTAVILGKGGRELFVTTAGQVNGTRVGGQVVRVEL